MNYLPDGHNHVSPYLVVDDADEMIEFLVNVFDGELIMKLDDEDGRVVHAEVKIFDSVIMIGEGGHKYPSTTGIYHVYVPDCDSIMKLAEDEGGIISREAQTFDDGNRRGSVLGPMGNTWTIATMIDN